MTVALHAIRFDANDPRGLARFWAGVLRAELAEDGVTLRPDAGTGPVLSFVPTPLPKTGLGRAHMDLTSASPQDQRETVRRALDLGARHLDVGQEPDADHVVLADPEGNEFCVIEPGNAFLAGCGSIGALACDGSREVGSFWSRALGWPLVWDQDEETAIQSPAGGMKISWGGPPIRERSTNDRLHLDLRVDDPAEIAHLVRLGASPIGEDGAAVLLTDPDGNEFRITPL